MDDDVRSEVIEQRRHGGTVTDVDTPDGEPAKFMRLEPDLRVAYLIGDADRVIGIQEANEFAANISVAARHNNAFHQISLLGNRRQRLLDMAAVKIQAVPMAAVMVPLDIDLGQDTRDCRAGEFRKLL